MCDYHREFYRPENLCLIITGQVEPEQVFAALRPVESRILSKVGLLDIAMNKIDVLYDLTCFLNWNL